MNEEILKFYKYLPTKKDIGAGKFCQIPYQTLNIDNDGDVQLCACTVHMPYTIGNVYQDSLQTIWNNEKATLVRDSVLNGEFTYCNWACPSLRDLKSRPTQSPILPEFPKEIKIDLDLSCNLKCPSCREDVIIEKDNSRIQKQIKLFEEIKSWAIAHPYNTIKLVPMARGEIFASHSGLEFLRSLREYPHNNLKLWLVSNGTLIKKNWDMIDLIKNNISEWSISLDAATPETYATVRGGNWETVMEGIQLINKSSPKRLQINFCIQKNNYHEIEQISDLANQFNAHINYQKIDNWGHWDQQWWHKNNVFDRSRDTFLIALDALNRVKQKYPSRVSIAAELINYLNKIH